MSKDECPVGKFPYVDSMYFDIVDLFEPLSLFNASIALNIISGYGGSDGGLLTSSVAIEN